MMLKFVNPVLFVANYISGSNLDNHPQFKGLHNDKHKKYATIHPHLSVPPQTLSYISTLMSDS